MISENTRFPDIHRDDHQKPNEQRMVITDFEEPRTKRENAKILREKPNFEELQKEIFCKMCGNTNFYKK